MKPLENKTVLANGVRVLTTRMPHARSISMGIWVDAGSRDETPEESGLCHLIEHMLYKGTPRRSAFQIAKEFDAIGGQSNAFTSVENTCCHARVTDSHLAVMSDILSDIFIHSSFDEAEYENERPVILQEIGMLEDSPEEYIHVLLSKAFWGSQSLGQSILGTRESLSRFDTTAIKTYFRKFSRPDRILITAAGNLTHDEVVSLIAPSFETLLPGGVLPERTSSFCKRETLVLEKDMEQAHISIGMKGLSMTSPGRFAQSLLNTVLGGNMSSRLFQEIRERRGLAYSVYSFVTAHTETGMFGAYAAVDPEKICETIELISTELKSLKEIDIDPGMLQNAKEFTKGSLMLASESVDNQMAKLAQNEFNFGRFVSLKEVMENIDRVSAAEVRDLAESLFQSEPLALAILGPVSEDTPYADALGI